MTPREYNAKRLAEIEAAKNPYKDFGITCDEVWYTENSSRVCGARMLVDTSTQTCSYPPYYLAKCEKCGKCSYVYC